MNTSQQYSGAQVKSCSTIKDDGKPCGWYAFDQVTILLDGPGSETAVPVVAYSCRSCGNILPDGISPEVYSQIKANHQ